MEKYELTDYHYFEVMDRSYVAVETFNEHIFDHPAVQNNQELKEKGKEVANLLYKFYCLTSAYLDDDKTRLINKAKEYYIED